MDSPVLACALCLGIRLAAEQIFPTPLSQYATFLCCGHIHVHLTIALNGQLLEIPEFLGTVPSSPTFGGCFYQIHNHDFSGKLHIESPTPVNYVLGSFFKIWGQPLTRTNVAGITSTPIVFYVTEADGTTTVYDGDPGAIALTSHRLITIQIGTPLTEIPNFTWAGD
ncbi:MAG TPA: hypothetical protein VLW55_03610 [Burkholderiaceae bacterium]|nr:hypothetical protein [Burkholderiaceae bacterium]